MRNLFSKLVVVLLLGFGAFTTCANAQQQPKYDVPGIPSNIPRYIPPADDCTQKLKDQKDKKDKKDRPAAQEDDAQSEKSIATTANVAVIFCSGSGRVSVRGWDKSEVRAVGESGSKVTLVTAKSNGESSPVSQVRVNVFDGDEEESFLGPCYSNSNVDLYVPRGAFVDLKTQEGDINVEKIAKARLRSLNGSFTLREISNSVQADSTSGDISIDNSSGEISLSAVSGSIDVRNVKSMESGDYLSAKAISGDVNLDRVNYLRVEGVALSGDVTLFGSLTKGAVYNLRSTSGDVTVTIPANSSFKVNAVISPSGEIICDFPITKPATNGTPRKTTTLIGTYGTGESTLNLTAINGTIHVRKK